MKTDYADIHRDLVEGSRKGNPRAQYELYRLYSKAMFNICYRMMNNREEAEDMLQESFTYAFSKLNSFHYDSSFGAWLKRITINKCINELKRKKTDLVLSENMHAFEYKSSENETIDESKIQFEVNQVKKAVEKLPDGYRIIFSLDLLEGYDHTEIANILGISESTSKSQYMRAKRKLLQILKKDGYER
ncbi:MAG: RNA polymerase [Marinilabiliales bacterium]|nr:MAG: RNA polymerase [Marinilabiliales bacterium]